jgi:stage V sporulation protein AC
MFHDVLQFTEKDSSLYVCVILIGIAAALTGIGVFDNIAKHAGAGTLLPITGFANAVVSPAIDTRAEGYVLGVGAKIFTVAGPVLLYGTLSGVAYGLIYWTYGLFK